MGHDGVLSRHLDKNTRRTLTEARLLPRVTAAEGSQRRRFFLRFRGQAERRRLWWCRPRRENRIFPHGISRRRGRRADGRRAHVRLVTQGANEACDIAVKEMQKGTAARNDFLNDALSREPTERKRARSALSGFSRASSFAETRAGELITGNIQRRAREVGERILEK